MIIPDQELIFDPPLRAFNLSGGVSCLVGSSGLCWLMLPGIHGSFWSELNKDTFQISKIETLRKISFQFFRNGEELNSCLFEQTYIDVQSDNGSLLDEAQIRRWMGLAVAYRGVGQQRKAIRAERISKQIRFCRSSIDKLHKAYRISLTDKANKEDFTDPPNGTFHFFSDPFSQNIAFNLQPCLDALYSFRDYVFTFLFEEMYGRTIKLAKASDFLWQDNRYGIAELVSSAISQAEPYGIVARATSYRNAFFHYLGSSAGPIAESYCLIRVDTALGQIPRVTYPLDDNFPRVRAIERGEFIGYGDPEQHKLEAQRFMSSGQYVDALDLCFDCLITLLQILEHMSKCIATGSQTLKITEKDIIEIEVVKDGVRQKYKRNARGALEKIEIEKK